MLNVLRREHVSVINRVEDMPDAMIGESVCARKRDKNFHGAVQEIARRREAIVTRKEGGVDVTVGADNGGVGNVGGARKYIQNVQENVEGIAELTGNAIE